MRIGSPDALLRLPLPSRANQMPKTTIVALDQSYTRLGYCVQTKRKVLEIGSVDLSKLRNPTQKRNCVRELVSILVRKHNPTAVLVERVRIFAGGYISAKTAGMLAAMTAVIVDAAYTHSFNRKPTPVFSVDTRAWKSVVLGNPSATKQQTLDWVNLQLGGDEFFTKAGINHDSADAYCIGKYLWLAKPLKIQREK